MKIKDTLQRDPAVHPLVNQGQARISDSRNERAQAELRGELETFVCEGQYADEQLGIVVETAVRRRELVADLRSERVLLLDPVDRHHEDSVVDDFGVHLPVSVSVHGGRLGCWLHDGTDNRRLSYMMQPTLVGWST